MDDITDEEPFDAAERAHRKTFYKPYAGGNVNVEDFRDLEELLKQPMHFSKVSDPLEFPKVKSFYCPRWLQPFVLRVVKLFGFKIY